jgi:NRPS condensation-like uncharacterized protein
MPFNLAAGPLVRALLICLSDNDHLLLLTMHHSVADGWSVKVSSACSVVTMLHAAPCF